MRLWARKGGFPAVSQSAWGAKPLLLPPTGTTLFVPRTKHSDVIGLTDRLVGLFIAFPTLVGRYGAGKPRCTFLQVFLAKRKTTHFIADVQRTKILFSNRCPHQDPSRLRLPHTNHPPLCVKYVSARRCASLRVASRFLHLQGHEDCTFELYFPALQIGHLWPCSSALATKLRH